ncbi:hypothetical protein KIW84_053058 [Lathyrus oleraceus]|uniref:Uncharacterized protein n=1 Tax=Pisum sativum TaxID=3888 RepID=A0A9D4WPA7_PEA|nr:hypothetical protein KIW84_053058 [Pisum sativum]
MGFRPTPDPDDPLRRSLHDSWSRVLTEGFSPTTSEFRRETLNSFLLLHYPWPYNFRAMSFFLASLQRLQHQACVTYAIMLLYCDLIPYLTRAGRADDASIVLSQLEHVGFGFHSACCNVMVTGFLTKPEILQLRRMAFGFLEEPEPLPKIITVHHHFKLHT